MTRTSASIRAVALAVALALLGSAPALADNPDKRRAHALMMEGNQLLDDGDYAAALVRFQRAYDVYPSPALLLNIGTALRALDRHAEASNNYARWLRATRRPKHRAEVEEALAQLDRLVGRVLVQVSEPGASISIAGRRVDEQIVDSVLRLDPGVHELVAQKNGFKPAIARVNLSAGEMKRVPFELEPSVLPRPEELEAPASTGDGDGDDELTEGPDLADSASDPIGSSLRISGLVVGGAGLISIAAGLKFGLDARRLSSEVEQASLAGDTAAVDDGIARGKTAENRFITFTAIGGAALVAGGVLYTIGRLRTPPKAERSLAVAPAVGGDMVGLAVSGAF